MTAAVGTVAGVFAALYAAHQVADHWVQTDHQAAHKGRPGWVGRWNCVKHVSTYTATAVVALVALAAVTGWRPGAAPVVLGLSVSAVTHYIADRRWPLRWLAERTGAEKFWVLGAPRGDRDDKPCLGTGAYALDQSWHIGWLFVASLVAAV